MLCPAQHPGPHRPACASSPGTAGASVERGHPERQHPRLVRRCRVRYRPHRGRLGRRQPPAPRRPRNVARHNDVAGSGPSLRRKEARGRRGGSAEALATRRSAQPAAQITTGARSPGPLAACVGIGASLQHLVGEPRTCCGHLPSGTGSRFVREMRDEQRSGELAAAHPHMSLS